MTEIIAYGFAVLIGVSLGLIGGGGSILTLPVLVYLLGINPVLSTAYSLFVVGSTALVGSVNYMKKGLVSYKTAIIFAIPSLTAVFLTRKYLIPLVPAELFTIGGFLVTKNIAIMIFFALVMLIASYSMIRDKREETNENQEPVYNIPLIIVEGILVGVLTGIVGAGGGFLIIPALVLLAKLPMKMAVGTSLLIIAAKSLIGFLGDVANQPIEWLFLLQFTGLSIVGIFIGTYLSKFIPGAKLKKGFGWFVLLMGVYIIGKEFLG
ncbi:MAG: sulfite exporter TauE/SafE family protein [Spirosomaceae bacterium]|nr:sulfite exporter TauE/SafE family protein [Spirosomataceae bacterium]